jgi:serine/threonine protein phosphatase PrpC
VRIRAGTYSHPGKVKKENEDAFLVRLREGVFLVADGMGGHELGQVASRMVVDAVDRRFGADVPSPAGEFDGDPSPDALRRLVAGIADANRRIWSELGREGERTTGSTAVGAVTERDALYVANVGDSRAYLLRDGRLMRLTVDHSQVQEMVDGGLLDRDQARTHPLGNILTRAVGVEEDLAVDAFGVRPVDGDRVLLCSDGVSKEVADDEIGRDLAVHDDPADAARSLVTLAVERGGHDNATALVLFVQTDGDAAKAGDVPVVRPFGSIRHREPSPVSSEESAPRAEVQRAEAPAESARRSPLLLAFALAVLALLGYAVWFVDRS